MKNFSSYNKLAYVLKASTAAAASTGEDSAAIDTSGFNAVTLIAPVGQTAADGTVALSARGSTASAGTYQPLDGATVTTTTGTMDGIVAIELDRPGFRFIKGRLVRATSDARHGGIIAVLSDPKAVPTTHDSTSMLQSLVRVVHGATS